METSFEIEQYHISLFGQLELDGLASGGLAAEQTTEADSSSSIVHSSHAEQCDDAPTHQSKAATASTAPTLILTIGSRDEAHDVWQHCMQAGATDLVLAAISGVSWDNDLTPWPAPPVFKRGGAFGGGADAFLHTLTKTLLPAVISHLGITPHQTVLAGYSLAGLFSMYAAYNSNSFDAVVSASGSLWYPDFMNYAEQHSLSSRVEKVYLSLGDKEAKTKNATMRVVEDNTRALSTLLAQRGLQTTFELNAGGHFVDSAGRLARGICWVLEAEGAQ